MGKNIGYCFQCQYFADPEMEEGQPLKGRCIINPPCQIDRTGLGEFPYVTALMRCGQFEKRGKGESPVVLHPVMGNQREMVDKDSMIAVISALNSALKNGEPQDIVNAYYGRIEDE
jgi:hypothetical protein